MKATIHVKGNAAGATPLPFSVDTLAFQWNGPDELVTEVSNQTELTALLQHLQPRLMFQTASPIQLHSALPGHADVVLRDPRWFIGPTPNQSFANDITTIRDVIIEHEISGGDITLLGQLRTSTTLLYAIEQFVKAILNTQRPLSDLYKCIEVIRSASGVAHSSKIFGSKAFVDYVTKRANDNASDERHAPDDPIATTPIPADELRECFVRTRQIILNYANTL